MRFKPRFIRNFLQFIGKSNRFMRCEERRERRDREIERERERGVREREKYEESMRIGKERKSP